VAYKTPGDTAVHVMATPSIKIVVESMKPSEAGDIKDIKPPVEIPLNWWLLLMKVGIGLLAVSLAVGGVLIYRRWKSGKGILPVREAPPKPPHEIAIEALDRLKASGLLQKGEIKAFYIELSEIIRRYIGGRYFVVAMEMTTTEVLEGLTSVHLADADYALFETFFQRCDLVKFAKYLPAQDETSEILRHAYDLVDRTKIVIEAPKTETDIEDVSPAEENTPTDRETIEEDSETESKEIRHGSERKQTDH
jgi:hypothetical protein